MTKAAENPLEAMFLISVSEPGFIESRGKEGKEGKVASAPVRKQALSSPSYLTPRDVPEGKKGKIGQAQLGNSSYPSYPDDLSEGKVTGLQKAQYYQEDTTHLTLLTPLTLGNDDIQGKFQKNNILENAASRKAKDIQGLATELADEIFFRHCDQAPSQQELTEAGVRSSALTLPRGRAMSHVTSDSAETRPDDANSRTNNAPKLPVVVEQPIGAVIAVPRQARTPSWSDMADVPTAADTCSCCRRSAWWTERNTPRGWRCMTCHPPLHLPLEAVRRERLGRHP
jgi:hypothetical protein